jgi:hypothetical protein
MKVKENKNKEAVMTAVKALKEFFVNPPVLMAELKALSKKERDELGEMACKEMGVEFTPSSEN